jgi:4-hydroxybenzoyl-CoA reductase subunit beta
MHALPEFTLQRPSTLAEAARLLAREPEARLIAGGTDLLPNLRRGLEQPPMLVDLSALRGFSGIELTDDGGMLLGAGVTLGALAADALVAERLPALAEAARAAAAPTHRSAATLGGNLCQDTRCIYYNQSEWWRASNGYCLKRGGDTCHVAPQGQRCHAAYSGDLAPVLLALDAHVELQSATGLRWLPLVQLYRDDGAAHLAFARSELLACVRVPSAPPGQASGYRKSRVRGAIDFPLAGVAIAVVIEAGRMQSLRVGLSGTNSQPLLLADTDALIGVPVDEESLRLLGKLVQRQVSPMRSTVTASNYRRQVAAVMAQRLLRELAGAG